MKDLFSIPRRYWRLLLYGAWFYALSRLLSDRSHETFLRPDFAWLLGLGILTLVGFAVAELAGSGDRARPSFSEVTRWLVLVAPLVYLPLASDVVLDSRALEKRWTGFEHSGALGGVPLVDQAAAAASDGLRSATLADLWRKARHYDGTRVRVDGMITRSTELAEDLGPDATLLYRFVMTCCVADAVPVAVDVAGDIPEDWPDDTWAQADGTLMVEDHEGQFTIRLRVDRIARIEPPSRPYLY